MRRINIAIDGPSAAGKSTISKLLAKRLGYVHLDTGAMYRCTAWKALAEGIALDDEAAVVRMLKNTAIELKADGSVLLDGKDVSLKIREDQVSMAASNVSKLKGVRALLVERQQEMARARGFVMDGRDIGTVVLKDAELKIYLTASARARALRRMVQNQEQNLSSGDLESIEKDIERRDYQDMHRENSPLTKAADAIEIDSSDLSIEQVVHEIESRAHALIEQEES